MEIKDIVWTPEKIGFFWDAYSTLKGVEDTYFTKMVGEGLISFIQKHVSIEGEICDYGAGHGYLTERVCKLPNTKVVGCDFSADSVKALDQKLSSYSNYSSTLLITSPPNTALADNQFDLIFFIETIEHVLPEIYQDTLKELYRVLKPGGKLVITTPNDEDLERNKVICPNCGSKFHRVQHLRSFNEQSLSQDLNAVGFKTALCTTFRPSAHQSPNGLVRKAVEVLRAARSKKHPSLLFVGEK